MFLIPLGGPAFVSVIAGLLGDSRITYPIWPCKLPVPAGHWRAGCLPWTISGGEVRCARSTWEAVEQGQPACGDGGGKERSQGERWTGWSEPQKWDTKL